MTKVQQYLSFNIYSYVNQDFGPKAWPNMNVIIRQCQIITLCVSCEGSRAVMVRWHEWHGAPGPAACLWGTEQRGGSVRGAAEPEGQVAGWAVARSQHLSPPACSPHLTHTTRTRTPWHKQTEHLMDTQIFLLWKVLVINQKNQLLLFLSLFWNEISKS